eukprot:1017869_1
MSNNQDSRSSGHIITHESPSGSPKPDNAEKVPKDSKSEFSGCSDNSSQLSDYEWKIPDDLVTKSAFSLLLHRSEKKIDARFRELGVNDPERVSWCLKRAIQRGLVWLDDMVDGISPLDQVVFDKKCIECTYPMKISIRDVMYQDDSPGYDMGEGAVVWCRGECGNRGYVSFMCTGRPQLVECGKWHNHCRQCPKLGNCIGGQTLTHCLHCNKHCDTDICIPCSHCGRYQFSSEEKEADFLEGLREEREECEEVIRANRKKKRSEDTRLNS